MGLDGSDASGRWPDEASEPPVPPRGSLLGSRTLVSQDKPEIRFQVSTSHDVLAPGA
jgi:hypothetical protein